MSVWARPLRPVATWMNASWFSNCAESLAVKRASRRILIRLVEATAFADNSSTSSTSGASSPKWSFTAPSMNWRPPHRYECGARAEAARPHSAPRSTSGPSARQFERRGGIETQRLRRHPVQLPAVRMEGRCPDRREHECRRLDGGRLTVEPVVDHVAGAQQPSCCGDPVEHVVGSIGEYSGSGSRCAPSARKRLADLGRPGESREHAHRFGDVVQNAGRLAVPVVWSRCVTGKVCQAGAMVDMAGSHVRPRVVADSRIATVEEHR